MIGNLGDLAALPSMPSEPTLTSWIKGEPDQFWILRRGSKGVEYEIDLEGAVEAWRGQEAAKTQAARDKADQLRQFGLDLGLNGCEDSRTGISLQDRNLLLEEEITVIKLSKLRGELISKAEVQAAATEVINENRALWESLGAELALKLDLDREQIAVVETIVATRLHRHADKMEKLGEPHDQHWFNGESALENTAIH